MSAKRAAIALLLLAGAYAAYAYRQSRGLDAAAAPEEAPADPSWWSAATDTVDTYTSLDYWIGANQEETAQKIEEAHTMIDQNANLAAFLQAIGMSEGTANQPNPYAVCYTYKHTIQSFSDHPAVTGEWKGEKLSDSMCKAAGLGSGCVSTAAGKYQITKTTWAGLKRKLGLPDFSPASQDAAAIELLRQSGALEFAKAGNVAAAAAACRKIWASLPGAGYEQPERSLAWIQRQYTNAGGVLA